jgi:hypothetical protein
MSIRVRPTGLVLALIVVASLAPGAEAKKFRYASGPKPPADSTLSVATPYLEPVVRTVGPRVPYTNLQLASFVADTAAARALAHSPLESGSHAVIAPAREHPLNFVLEHALVNELTRRGVSVTVRRTPVPDDSLASVFGHGGDPLVEYTLGSARTTYLRLVGWIPGRVKIERQSLVEGSVAVRDPATSRLLWSGDLGQNFVDRFSRSQVELVEDPHYPELKDNLPTRNLDKVAEPVIVVGIVGGLVALFFQNRP